MKIASLSRRFINDTAQGEIVGWHSYIKYSHNPKQMKVKIESRLTCKAVFKAFRHQKLMCGKPVNPKNSITEVNNFRGLGTF